MTQEMRRRRNFVTIGDGINSGDTTLNVRSLDSKRADTDFYYSYLESLSHDALAVAEAWNTQRHYDSWRCVTDEPNLIGEAP